MQNWSGSRHGYGHLLLQYSHNYRSVHAGWRFRRTLWVELTMNAHKFIPNRCRAAPHAHIHTHTCTHTHAHITYKIAMYVFSCSGKGIVPNTRDIRDLMPGSHRILVSATNAIGSSASTTAYFNVPGESIGHVCILIVVIFGIYTVWVNRCY